MQGIRESLPNEDILTLIHVSDNKAEEIFLSDKLMCSGEDLEKIRETYIPNIISNKRYEALEAAHLKAYTLLASLTKRIKFAKFENEDENYRRVVETIMNNLSNIEIHGFRLFNRNEAFELTAAGCLKHFKIQPLASKFNRKIAETMAVFFR